jgi:hypothetical protein
MGDHQGEIIRRSKNWVHCHTPHVSNQVTDCRSKTRQSYWGSPNLRLSLSLSTILLFHRLLFRFFTRLRAHLLTSDAKPFRKRNPRTSKVLTSSYAPAVGASLSGFMLGVYPKDQFRTTVAMTVLSNAAEVTYNLAENEGWIWGKKGSKWERPWWWGSWMLMPVAYGQLLHAFVFDRDCFPQVLLVKCGNPFRTFAKPFLGFRRVHSQKLPTIYSTAAVGLSREPSMASKLRDC